MTIGESFSGSPDPGNLKDQLATLGYAYYRNSHAANMQSLFASLEKEQWLPIPLQHQLSSGDHFRFKIEGPKFTRSPRGR